MTMTMTAKSNMDYYEKLRSVPEQAKKTINAGKLKGFTDINPMWRIKALTELFGPCGIGWKAPVKRKWLEIYENVVCAFCDIELYYRKPDGEWSDPIDGTGGSKFVSQTRNGADVSDECFKMAYTDAISVAAKMLGVGADVYWSNDICIPQSKYEQREEDGDGTDLLRYEDRKKLAAALVSAYGDADAVRNLIRLTGRKSTTEVTYDEMNWAIEKIEREKNRLEMDSSDFIDGVQIAAVKDRVTALYGEYSEDNLFALTGLREDDLPNITKVAFGHLAREINDLTLKKKRGEGA